MACVNDCVEPLRFPTRPFNRPSLSQIAYRIGTYTDFREALLRALDENVVLSGWTHREPDDAGIALLECAAITGDILTFYLNLYANEAYLRTARQRDSIGDLVRLTGYRLAPGVGGRATFEVKSAITVPAGYPIQASVTGLPAPATFETSTDLAAVPALGRFSLYRPFVEAPIANGTRTFAVQTAAIASAGIQLSAGDRLMLVAGGGLHPLRQIVVVESTQTRFEQTEITAKGGWTGGAIASPLALYKLGRSFRWFGYNAPLTETHLDEAGVAHEKGVEFRVTVAAGVVATSTLTATTGVSLDRERAFSALRSSNEFPLDKQVDDLSAGALLLISLESSGKSFFYVRSIGSVRKSSYSVGQMTGGTTVVGLEQGLTSDRFFTGLVADLRTVEFHEVIGRKAEARGARIAAASPPAEDTSKLYFFGTAATYRLLDGRRLQFTTNGSGNATIAEETVAFIDPVSLKASPSDALPRPIRLSPMPTRFSLDDFNLSGPAAIVWGNLADATQGKTEPIAVLGNGDARQAFLTFRIPKAPLTYRLSKSATPPQVPEVQLTIDNRIWTPVSSLFGREPDEQVYIVREDSDGNSWVQFGDGATGARPNSGIGNVSAKFRTGVGAFGPLKPGAAPQAGARLDGLDKIHMEDESSGGASPESGENARGAAPGRTQSLGRLVSLADFEAEAGAIPGVSRNAAAWALIDGIPSLAITVLMDTGRAFEIAAVRETLAAYNTCRGPSRFPIRIIQGFRSYVFLSAVFALRPGFLAERVTAAVRQALADLFSVSARSFGAREYKTRVEGIIQDVEGVLWSIVRAFGALGDADDPSTLALPPAPLPLQEVVACAPDRILALDPAHAELAVSAAAAPECA